MQCRNFIVVALGAAASLTGPAVVAADFEPHVFYSVSIGNSDTDFRPSVTDVIDGSETSFAIGVGWALSPHWSVRGRYHDFGDPTGWVGCPPEVFCIAIVPFAAEEVAVDGWSAVVDGTWPVTDRFGLFARLGVLAWDMSATSSPLDASGEDLLYGAGAHFNMTARWGLELAFEKADVNIDTVQLGVTARF